MLVAAQPNSISAQRHCRSRPLRAQPTSLFSSERCWRPSLSAGWQTPLGDHAVDDRRGAASRIRSAQRSGAAVASARTSRRADAQTTAPPASNSRTASPSGNERRGRRHRRRPSRANATVAAHQVALPCRSKADACAHRQRARRSPHLWFVGREAISRYVLSRRRGRASRCLVQRRG
jgi:hypothetical protein